MKGTIVNFRRGRHRTTGNQMVIRPEGAKDVESAKDLVGKSVSWKTPAGKELTGKVAGAHGTKGCVRALFDSGMPGQAIGRDVEIK